MIRRALACALAAAGLATGAAHAGEGRLALTFDDLPVHGALPPGVTREAVARRIAAALGEAGSPPVYGFVNGQGTVTEPGSQAALSAWRAAGFPLGNHTWSHLRLTDDDLAAWEADVVRNEPLLERASPGGDWRWLRFPFLAEGSAPATRRAARAFLKARGYRIAGVTMSFGDFAYNAPYARCVARGGAGAASLEKAYLDGARAEIVRARALSQAAYGRQIPFVLLMHVGALDARMLPRLLALYKAEGFRFVSLQDAERDRAYASDVDLAGDGAGDTLEAAARARGYAPPPGPDLSHLATLCRPPG